MSPKEITKVDITTEVFKEPIEVIKKLSSNLEGLKYTKVIQTFVMEDRRLNLMIESEGSNDFRGKVVWIGNKKDETIRIFTASKTKCAVCGKSIEIFDEVIGCPLCDIKAHKDHLIDWVRMKHSCPVCKKSLDVSSTGVIFIN
jgi:rubredoxin